MSVQSAPYYWIVCDCCGAKCGMGDYSVMSDESDARTYADANGRLRPLRSPRTRHIGGKESTPSRTNGFTSSFADVNGRTAPTTGSPSGGPEPLEGT